MGVYVGYSYLRTQGNIIEIQRIGFEGVVRERDGQYIIVVNDILNLERQVQAVIHELLYLSPKYRSYIESGGFWTQGHSKELEDKIEQEEDFIYECQPILVAHLRERMRHIRDTYKRNH